MKKTHALAACGNRAFYEFARPHRLSKINYYRKRSINQKLCYLIFLLSHLTGKNDYCLTMRRPNSFATDSLKLKQERTKRGYTSFTVQLLGCLVVMMTEEHQTLTDGNFNAGHPNLNKVV